MATTALAVLPEMTMSWLSTSLTQRSRRRGYINFAQGYQCFTKTYLVLTTASRSHDSPTRVLTPTVWLARDVYIDCATLIAVLRISPCTICTNQIQFVCEKSHIRQEINIKYLGTHIVVFGNPLGIELIVWAPACFDPLFRLFKSGDSEA
ncbi:hypothetical protein BaRGS_00001516 [Batillaria attramentaria]|uniref:Uncharacterized protein n=1 Tax=Batillaria attramentaria TaxID=370345 RepID=A0ABD0M7E2_9CAEN